MLEETQDRAIISYILAKYRLGSYFTFYCETDSWVEMQSIARGVMLLGEPNEDIDARLPIWAWQEFFDNLDWDARRDPKNISLFEVGMTPAFELQLNRQEYIQQWDIPQVQDELNLAPILSNLRKWRITIPVMTEYSRAFGIKFYPDRVPPSKRDRVFKYHKLQRAICSRGPDLYELAEGVYYKDYDIARIDPVEDAEFYEAPHFKRLHQASDVEFYQLSPHQNRDPIPTQLEPMPREDLNKLIAEMTHSPIKEIKNDD